MEFIVGKTGTGKTTAIIKEFLKDPVTSMIITIDEREAARVRNEVSKVNPDIPWGDLLSRIVHIHSQALVQQRRNFDIIRYVDNVDMILENLLGQVKLAAFNSHDHHCSACIDMEVDNG